MKHLAIIPARSGSKGLPDKNIRPLAGKPLMAYTIEAARKSGLFDQVVVSTDSEVYASIAREYGAEVPYLRPAALATDTASSWDVVRDLIGYFEEKGEVVETVCLLQPTSPLRSAQDIQNAYALLEERQAASVVSVCEMDHSPLWSNTLDESHSLESFIADEILTTPRQQLPPYYRLNGALYIVRRDALNKNFSLYTASSIAYIMSKENSVDIDDKFDFQFAETLLS